MAKKVIVINDAQVKSSAAKPRKLTAKDRRRIARWEKQVEYAKQHGKAIGFHMNDAGPDYKINENPTDRVEKALATPFPRDEKKEQEEPYEDVMY